MRRFSTKLLLTMLISTLSTSAFADYDIVVENADGMTIYYRWTNNQTELAVCNPVNTPSYPYAYSYYYGDVFIPESVHYNGKDYKVTSISDCAFRYCWELTSVSIPNTVASIGNWAFESCNQITTISIPSGVTSIGKYAFKLCQHLSSISLPSTLVSIGDNAFKETAWYDSQPDGLVYLGKVLYKYKGIMPDNTDIVIENGMLGIADGAFSECKGLSSVTIPNTIISIGEEAFFNCSGLTSMSIPNNVNTINSGTFAGCSGLTSVTIPDNVTSIGDNAFSYCSNLSSVIIPNSVTSIDEGAFRGCI